MQGATSAAKKPKLFRKNRCDRSSDRSRSFSMDDRPRAKMQQLCNTHKRTLFVPKYTHCEHVCTIASLSTCMHTHTAHNRSSLQPPFQVPFFFCIMSNHSVSDNRSNHLNQPARQTLNQVVNLKWWCRIQLASLPMASSMTHHDAL